MSNTEMLNREQLEAKVQQIIEGNYNYVFAVPILLVEQIGIRPGGETVVEAYQRLYSLEPSCKPLLGTAEYNPSVAAKVEKVAFSVIDEFFD